MAVTDFTASIASGALTDVLFFNNGPQLWMVGHFVAPASGTALIEPGMFNVSMAAIEKVDVDTQYFSANSNGTYAVLASGLATGESGYFMIVGY